MSQISANKMILEIATNLAVLSDRKIVMCDVDSDGGAEGSPTETKTKRCGTLVAPPTPTHSVNLSGVVEVDPGSGFMSAAELLYLCNTSAKVHAWYKNEADTSAGQAEGEAWHQEGEAYITNVRTQATADDFLKFSMTLTFTGTVNTVYGS